jgi:serine phosphatase RsbU (regulator of sigma subunit)
VVSLNALEDILEAIVRLAPILIGVKRCAIFLWDSSQSAYQLSRTYGFSRAELNEIQPTYRSEDFSFLEAVRLSNALAYCAYGENTEAPITWPGLGEEDFGLVSLERHNEQEDYGGAEALESRDHFRIQSGLLFAYPLTVKGSVLGVMVTQEMESSGIPTVHIRQKRHEISLGITQQAALAIQNDLLQHEVLERERLEQEMQLARNIQQTFLPDSLPLLKNWDLDVRWKPAHEVGGDFYDVILLPENHIGIVIADVADKGMPAALYMTLICTLIRAAARELLSPAAVLKRVNDILVNESKHGMFVTVAYAVIQLDTGATSYANAGHNYPLLFSRNKSMIRLPTTTMALGILEGISVGELTYQLEPDDLLVFYTDGVTEAFAASGEMFGEARLCEVILNHKTESASDVLQAIEQSILDHIQGAPVSDDVTLVALRFAPHLSDEIVDANPQSHPTE